MRKFVLSGVSALGLLVSAGLASAQDTAAGAAGAGPIQPVPGTAPAGSVGGAAGADTAAGTPATMGPAATTGTSGTTGATTADTAGQPAAMGGVATPEATAATGSTAGATMDGQYRSYSSVGQDWQGEVAGGHSVEDLMGRNVVGPDGDNIAQVSDLVIGADNSIRQVIVDVGGFLGIGATPVALDIDQLQITPGQDGDIRTNLTREQLEALPRYDRDDQGVYTQRTGG